MPFYVAPEQQMKDRADFARKGIARGRSVIVTSCADGVLFCAENHSRTLRKISEIYDRIGFAAVGRYNEFENLRIAGIRYADLRGYAYDRRDVTARGLANQYAQQLGTVFAGGMEKPFEVELAVAELGDSPELDQIFRVAYDGSISEERGWAVMGGDASTISERFKTDFDPHAELGPALKHAVAALSREQLSSEAVEVALLDRGLDRERTFRRLGLAELNGLMA